MENKPNLRMPQTEKRNLLASVFVTVMIGIAYQEMLPPVRESIRVNGFTIQTVILFAIFFMTSIRFFIGNQLQMVNDSLSKLPGLVWLYDLIVVIFQCILFTFMAGVMTVDANRAAKINFFFFLIGIYAIDVLWIATQWLMGLFFRRWRRSFIPWAWAVLNLCLVIAMLWTSVVIKDPFSDTSMEIMFGINLIGFLVDVILVDVYDVI